MMINNSRDLRIAYETLELIKDFFDKVSDKAKAEKHMQDVKQAIRAYNRRKSDRRIISGDYDSVLYLIDVPQGVTDIDAWFDENERRVCMPSQYDCTGQAFTAWYKVVKRADGYKVYHLINYDV